MLFHRRGFCGSARLFVTFGVRSGMMTTARPGLPYPCSSQAKTRDESEGDFKNRVSVGYIAQ